MVSTQHLFTRTSPVWGWFVMVASALLTPFAYAPCRLYWLMPILMAAMLVVAVKYQPYRLRMVYVWALIAYFVQCYWINTALHDIAGLPSYPSLPLTALLPLYLALFTNSKK